MKKFTGVVLIVSGLLIGIFIIYFVATSLYDQMGTKLNSIVFTGYIVGAIITLLIFSGLPLFFGIRIIHKNAVQKAGEM